MLPVRFPIPPKPELKERYDVLAPAYRRILDRTGERLTRLLQDRGIKFSLRYRVKEFDSFYEKIIRRSREAGLLGAAASSEGRAPAITDILGLRVVCHFLEDLDAARDAIESLFEVVESELKGSEYSSREFGYQSIHYLVQLPEELWAADLETDAPIAEIQLRTILQDAWAEVEHEILYKAEFTPLDEPLRRKLAALNANLTLSDIMFQELREYQRSLHSALDRRRAEFERQMGTPNSETPGELGDAAVMSLDPAPARRGAHTIPQQASAEAARRIHRETLDNLLLDALTAHNAGDFDGALETYTHILETDISDAVRAVILIHRGMAYVSKNDLVLAIGDFDGANHLDPNNPRPHHLRAAALRACGRIDDAADDTAEAVRLDPFFLDAWVLGAQIAVERGEIGVAREYCDRAGELAPDDHRIEVLLQKLEHGS